RVDVGIGGGARVGLDLDFRVGEPADPRKFLARHRLEPRRLCDRLELAREASPDVYGALAQDGAVFHPGDSTPARRARPANGLAERNAHGNGLPTAAQRVEKSSAMRPSTDAIRARWRAQSRSSLIRSS